MRINTHNAVVEITKSGAKVVSLSSHPSSILPNYSWPVILRPMKKLAKPGDRGLGDIIAREIGPIGGNLYKKWYRAIFGHECTRCERDQENLNISYPLDVDKLRETG